ncbi:hypothetical protein GGI11_005737 [Coemansia sp. RSA 2049]|nr:hypothetical protein GGI11_005737 [Coemansia sp. RSA 2049]
MELLRREAELADKFTKASLREAELATWQSRVEEMERFEIIKADYEHYVKHALTVDEFTPTLEELGTTRSRDVIATSREYIAPVREDHDKLRAGEITFEEAQLKKEELLKKLVKQQDARRQRERRASGKIIKKQVERDVSKMSTKATDSLSMSIDEFRNTVPIEYKDVVLIVPTQQEIEQVVSNQAERCLDEAVGLDRLIHGNSFTMQIVGEGVFNVVSLYPSAMKMLDHPHGKMQLVRSINWKKIGIYEVVLSSSKCPDKYMQFVPFRDQKGGLSYHWRNKWQGTYHTYDLLIAKQEGYNIECIRGIEWNKGKLFDTFVDKLFKMKADTPCQCTVKCPGKCPEGGPIRMVAKIALNGGGYGKFVQKPIDTDLYVVRRGIVHGAFERMEKNSEGMVVKARHVINMPKFYPLDDTWDKMVIEDPEALPQYPTQVGISILSGSRYRLYMLCKEFPNMDIVYSDTDSIFVRQSTIETGAFRAKCGKELGQLDDTIGNTDHGTIDRMYIAGPKMYAYEYHDKHGLPQQVVHCKGVRNEDLKMSHFEWVCKDVDYRIKYNMIIMAKNIVSVRTQNIDKEIKQT